MSHNGTIASRSRTKIVATVGPACSQRESLQALAQAGVDVFRLNMAHGNRQQHESAVRDIRAVSESVERPLGILVDLAGPKIRLGTISPDPLNCPRRAEFRFARELQSPEELTSNYDRLIDELDIGDRILLADGTVEMVVTAKTNDEVRCEVTGPGEIRSRQGINLPGVKLSVPAMNDIDRDNARWAAEAGADFVSLSFVRAAADILELKDLLHRTQSSALAIAKIEKPEAIEHLEAIVKAADGIMVARGDLGVEIDVAEMPVQQKLIIQTCQTWKKPVIVATQMLDSMQRSSRPTRAEVTDVANAIYDGTDACMLSGETAIGKFPVESVSMMNRIMQSTEASLVADAERSAIRLPSPGYNDPVHAITSAVITGAGYIAQQLEAKIVVIATHSGATALAKAKCRDFIPTIAVSDRPTTLRQMTLFWGIDPVAVALDDLDRELVPFIIDWGRRRGMLQPADRVVFVAGSHVYAEAHNQLVVHQVE